MPRETWYVLEDGRVVDPGECVADAKGALAHSSGVKVAMRLADCPMSRGVDPDEERAKAAIDAEAQRKAEPEPEPEPEQETHAAGKAMQAGEPRKPYRTRALKAD